jgi:formate hydrogenlyase subunit 3/multisubunit Na+/H+ antiporter MnhD subunit
MNEMVQISIGVLILIIGIFIGNILANFTKDEKKQGQKWFRLLVLIGLIGGITGLIIRNDIIMFTFFFIAIVSSKSTVRK